MVFSVLSRESIRSISKSATVTIGEGSNAFVRLSVMKYQPFASCLFAPFASKVQHILKIR